jgi:hypothetical protein
VPQRDAEPELEGWVNRWFAAERERAAQSSAFETITETHDQDPTTRDSSESAPSEYIDAEGRHYYALLINDERYVQTTSAAVLVLQADTGTRRRPPLRLLHNIAKLLVDHGDVQGARFGPAVLGTGDGDA